MRFVSINNHRVPCIYIHIMQYYSANSDRFERQRSHNEYLLFVNTPHALVLPMYANSAFYPIYLYKII